MPPVSSHPERCFVSYTGGKWSRKGIIIMANPKYVAKKATNLLVMLAKVT